MVGKLVRCALVPFFLTVASRESAEAAPEAPRSIALTSAPDDVIPTGNDWIALPSIRARDGALEAFNVISMRYRGLVQYGGSKDRPLLTPFIEINGVRRPLAGLQWSLRDYWIPTGTMEADGVRVALTYVAPPGHRAAIIRFQVTNLRATPLHLAPGIDVAWGRTSRITYSPEPLSGARTLSPTPIDSDMEIFRYGTDDTQLAWGVAYLGSQAILRGGTEPGLVARHETIVAPGQTLDVQFLLGVGLEQYSAAYAMRVLTKSIDRYGIDGVISRAADDAHWRTRTTGDPTLDRVMNRNMLFTTYFAWGRALDSDDFVGMTSRSDRYYVSAAYWDRDALLWSFPALLDSDPARAREALDYALGRQARNIGVHSRFIDGVVLEEGLELDELVAPIVALRAYLDRTPDRAMLARHRTTLDDLVSRIMAQRDEATGLFATFQDSEDEYVRRPFSIYANVLTWRALLDWSAILSSAGERRASVAKARDAATLKAAILHYGVREGAPGAPGPIFAASVDQTTAEFMDVPPGSLLRLPALGFVAESDPLFQRTYAWLHSADYRYGFADKRFGLPGSYRLPFTTSWSVADHLWLPAGRERALTVLRQSPWDGGIISEGVNPDTALADNQGRAFATAAGYVAYSICAQFCLDRPTSASR